MFNISQTSISTLGATQIIYITAATQDLRNEFIKLGAATTQLPRNPVPIHQLILRVIPNVRGKSISRNDIFKILTEQGWTKNFERRSFDTTIVTLVSTGKLKVAKKKKNEWVKSPRGNGFRKIKVNTYFASL